MTRAAKLLAEALTSSQTDGKSFKPGMDTAKKLDASGRTWAIEFDKKEKPRVIKVLTKMKVVYKETPDGVEVATYAKNHFLFDQITAELKNNLGIDIHTYEV